jgi:hypothetical protein
VILAKLRLKPKKNRDVGPLLSLSAEWAPIRSGVERFAAMPAEARLRGFPCLDAILDVLGVARADLGRRCSASRTPARRE